MSELEESGIPKVEVKFKDIRGKTKWEVSSLGFHWRWRTKA